MKRISVLFFLFSFYASAQVGFFKGSIITKSGEIKEGLIQNFYLHKEAKPLLFKETRNGNISFISTDDVDYILKGSKKFIVADVDIDNTSDNLQFLDMERRERKFNFRKIKLFLQVLVDGDAKLYQSYLDKRHKFFFVHPSKQIRQLLFKRYFSQRDAFYIGNDFIEANNYYYYGQLYSYVKCLNKKQQFVPPKYEKPQLVAYFERYNAGTCN